MRRPPGGDSRPLASVGAVLKVRGGGRHSLPAGCEQLRLR